MKNYKTFLRTDLMIQMGLMGLILAGIIYALGTLDPTSLIGSMFGAFFLGLWQVTSALVLGIYLKCKERCKYLVFVCLFLISFMVATNLEVFIPSQIGKILFGLPFLFFPIIFAFWYLFKTYADYRGSYYKVRDFWSIS